MLKPRGLLFLNLGDTYYSGKGRPQGKDKSKTVELKVDFHPIGNYTLKVREGTKGAFTDLDPDGPLFCNYDKGEFDRAVAREIARRRADGWRIIYSDTEHEAM